jgi:hypothetical protein
MLSVLQQSFWDRLAGVVTLQRPAYESIQRDPEATGQSWLIVLLLGLANGIALIATPVVTVLPGMSEQMARDAARLAELLTFETTGRQLLGLAAGVAGAVLSWYVSSWLLRIIGNRVSGVAGKVSAEEMRRLVAWGYSPTLASFLAPIPLLGPLLATLGTLWAFVTGVMAIRAAFDVGIWKAIGIEIAAFLVVLVVVLVILIAIVVIAWPLA